MQRQAQQQAALLRAIWLEMEETTRILKTPYSR